MQRLTGQKVWVVQFDDEDSSVIGIVEGVENNFIALRSERDSQPTIYINLANVKEIELYMPEGEGELRILRFPDADERSQRD